jgi:hypothetical protein
MCAHPPHRICLGRLLFSGSCFGLSSVVRRGQDRKGNICPSLYFLSPAEGLISCSHAFEGKIHILFASCLPLLCPSRALCPPEWCVGPAGLQCLALQSPLVCELLAVPSASRFCCCAKFLQILRFRQVPRLPGTNLIFSAGWGSLAPKPVFLGPWPLNPCLGHRSRT